MGGEYDGTQNISVANSLFLSHPCSLSGDSQAFGPRESRGNRAPEWARAWGGGGGGGGSHWDGRFFQFFPWEQEERGDGGCTELSKERKELSKAAGKGRCPAACGQQGPWRAVGSSQGPGLVIYLNEFSYE